MTQTHQQLGAQVLQVEHHHRHTSAYLPTTSRTRQCRGNRLLSHHIHHSPNNAVYLLLRISRSPNQITDSTKADTRMLRKEDIRRKRSTGLNRGISSKARDTANMEVEADMEYRLELVGECELLLTLKLMKADGVGTV